ncbi:MAG: host-nuclease inhibitor Gam family protein [Ignavibacteriaceae bacterium]|nr:host-nuclease inhibitor Gam family protein [Ignavibacteriaceae bacterium]
MTTERTIKDWSDLETVITELAEIRNEIEDYEVQLNNEIDQIKAVYQEKTKDLRDADKELEAIIEAFCTARKKEFEKTRSREFLSGVVGFRFTTPAVKVLNRKYNWNTVLELIKATGRAAYLRVKQEIDKDKILADYSSGAIDDTQLAGIGVKVDQEDKFYLTIKKEELKDGKRS